MPGETPLTPVTTPSQTVPAPLWLNDILSWDGKSPDTDQRLTTAFEAGDYLTCIKNLEGRGVKPLSYIDSLDRMVDSLPLDSDPRRRCIRALRKTCGLYGVLPDSYTITYSLSKSPNQRPFANGGFCDVWRIADETDKKTYAVKSLRVYEEDPVDKINKKYCKEVIVCKRVRHRNILSIEGVAPRLFEFCMVSQWMEHGHILDYVNRYQEVNRLELLIGVTCGLNYLHCNEVVHGDLKSPNILVDGEGTPRLSDFGLCSITKNIDTVNASTPNHGSTVRYCAPELLDHEETPRVEKKKATNKSDVYSYSMVIVELVTGQVPFADSTEYNVVSMVSKGKRPPKPRRFDAPGTSKAVWEVAEKCWHSKPDKRPEVKEALQYLNGINAGVDGDGGRPTWSKRFREIFE